MAFTDAEVLLEKMNSCISGQNPVRIVVVGISFVPPRLVANLSERNGEKNDFDVGVLGAK